MKLQKKTNSSGRMNKLERQRYIEKLDRDISSLPYQDQVKIEFAKTFVNDLQLFKAEDGDQIQIGPVDRRILEYFIFSILIEFEHMLLES